MKENLVELEGMSREELFQRIFDLEKRLQNLSRTPGEAMCNTSQAMAMGMGKAMEPSYPSAFSVLLGRANMLRKEADALDHLANHLAREMSKEANEALIHILTPTYGGGIVYGYTNFPNR